MTLIQLSQGRRMGKVKEEEWWRVGLMKKGLEEERDKDGPEQCFAGWEEIQEIRNDQG